jgi:predicted RNase H-like HicB family nuclease
MRTVTVKAEWDDEAGVWVAESDDVPGLATGADTIEELVERLKVVIPEMLEENGIACEPGLRFKIDAKRSEIPVRPNARELHA